MLVYDVMQGRRLSDGRLYSDVYGPVLIRSRLINNHAVLLSTGIIEYKYFIEFNRENGYDIYYVD